MIRAGYFPLDHRIRGGYTSGAGFTRAHLEPDTMTLTPATLAHATNLATLTPEDLESMARTAGTDLVTFLDQVVDEISDLIAALRQAPPELLTPGRQEIRIALRRLRNRLEDWIPEIESFRRLEASTARQVAQALSAARDELAMAVELHRAHPDEITIGRVAIARRRVTALERDLAAWTR